ncbi:hypothetical protein T02_7476 [Trichinella nativa]|uniref:Uncharacterized protein n=1 Tax=Trichinella nativa TaxID=6335 RepID=A0A0V1KGY1_9BILA|nr:hypothetical protein T02_7476 [Trichinella nativa]
MLTLYLYSYNLYPKNSPTEEKSEKMQMLKKE